MYLTADAAGAPLPTVDAVLGHANLIPTAIGTEVREPLKASASTPRANGSGNRTEQFSLNVCLGALEDEVPPAAGRIIVQCVDDIDETQRWLEGRE